MKAVRQISFIKDKNVKGNNFNYECSSSFVSPTQKPTMPIAQQWCIEYRLFLYKNQECRFEMAALNCFGK